VSLHAAESTFDAGFEFSIIHYQFSMPKMKPREKERHRSAGNARPRKWSRRSANRLR
jgi:hypothetical protein